MVEDAVAAYPEVFKAKPSNRTPGTVASQIRDAIKGAIEFEYPTAIGTARLREWWSQVVVRVHGAEVWIGPAALVSQRVESIKPITGEAVAFNVSAPTTKMEYVTELELDALILLLSTNRLSGPVRIQGNHTTKPLPPNVTATFRDGETLFF